MFDQKFITIFIYVCIKSKSPRVCVLELLKKPKTFLSASMKLRIEINTTTDEYYMNDEDTNKNDIDLDANIDKLCYVIPKHCAKMT